MPFHHTPSIPRSFYRNSRPQASVCKNRSEYDQDICSVRREYNTSNDENRPRISYFNRLPLELKVEIYANCLASYPSLSTKEAPLLLCRVSSSWRGVVQSTPKLWARFNIKVPNFGATDPTHNQSRMNALNLWLERSRNNELSIRITHSVVDAITDSRSAHLLAALIPHAHRWKDVDLHIPSSSIEPLQDSSLDVLPALRSVTLDMKGLWRSRVPFDVQSLGIPWGQLTTLSLHFDFNHVLTLDKCSDILSQCARLTRCSVNADCTFTTRGRLPHKINLPMLTHFSLMLHWGERFGITDRAGSCLVSFLEQLEFPKLQSFALQWLVNSDEGGRHWSEVHPRFLSILGTVAPTLRSLALAYLPLTDAEVVESLAQLHNLSYLELRFSLADREQDPITDEFLRACTLRPDGPSPGILPLLESVHLQCYGARHTATHVIIFIQSRRIPIQGDVNLRSFSLVSMKPVSAHTRHILEQWSEEGLEVSMDQVVIR